MSASDWKDKLSFAYSTNPNYRPEEDDKPESETLLPEKQNLRVRYERKNRGGKAVTIVSGFVGDEGNLKELGKTLKAKLGVGGSVKEGEIIIQGDFRTKLLNLLQEMGYKKTRGQ